MPFADDRPERPPAHVDPVSNDAKLSLSAENRSVEGLEVEKTARGAIKAHLHGRFQHALVLRIAPDGSTSIECIDSAEREAELLAIDPGKSSDQSDDAGED